MDWTGLKILLEASGLAKDAWHIYFALFIQVAAALALRVPLSSWRPWFWVLGIELLNELLDIILTDDVMFQNWQLEAARHDVLNTMALPTALLLLCRYLPQLFQAFDPSGSVNDPQGEPGALEEDKSET